MQPGNKIRKLQSSVSIYVLIKELDCTSQFDLKTETDNSSNSWPVCFGLFPTQIRATLQFCLKGEKFSFGANTLHTGYPPHHTAIM